MGRVQCVGSLVLLFLVWCATKPIPAPFHEDHSGMIQLQLWWVLTSIWIAGKMSWLCPGNVFMSEPGCFWAQPQAGKAEVKENEWLRVVAGPGDPIIVAPWVAGAGSVQGGMELHWEPTAGACAHGPRGRGAGRCADEDVRSKTPQQQLPSTDLRRHRENFLFSYFQAASESLTSHGCHKARCQKISSLAASLQGLKKYILDYLYHLPLTGVHLEARGRRRAPEGTRIEWKVFYSITTMHCGSWC